MRFKKKGRVEGVCDGSRCKATEGLVGYGPGVATDEAMGTVWLCPRHVRVLDGDKEVEPQQMTDEEVQKLMAVKTTDAEAVLTMTRDFQITTQGDMDFANECLRDVKGELKWINEERGQATKPMNTALAVIRGWFKPAQDHFEASKKIWNDKILAFLAVQEEAQRKAMASVQQANAAGDVAGVAQAMTQAAGAVVEAPKGQSTRETWHFEITDPAAVPAVFCSPDPAKITAAIAQGGGDPGIPGVRVFKRKSIVNRG